MKRAAPRNHRRESMRILVAHNVARRRNGGMNRIMGFIHDQVALAGHAVDYFCAEDVPAPLNGRLTRFTFPILVFRHAVHAARLGKPYDIINVHEPQAGVISSFKRAAGNPVVVATSHGVERRAWELALEEARLGRKGPTLKTRLIYPLTSLWQSKVGLQRSDHIFCLNYEDRDYLLGWLRIADSKLTRIFPGAASVYAEAARKRDYARATCLLFASTWRKNKGIEDLVPAFTILAERHPELALIVLGGGVPQSIVMALFPKSLRVRISFVDTTSEPDTAAVFAAADVYILPSLFEGTPLTLMEAMMSGLPIVATATCGMKDVIQNGRNGLLVPIRSPEAIVKAVEQLIVSPTYRACLGRAAQEDALGKYTWQKVAEPVRSVYEQLCDGRIG